MSFSFNQVTVGGYLTRDVELKYLPSGMACADLSLAVNDKRKQGDAWVDEVSFFDVTLFGKTAEVAGQYLSKGSPVLITGRLKQESWEKDGQKRSKVKVIGERMQMIGGKGDGGGSSGSAKPSAPSASAESDDDAPL